METNRMSAKQVDESFRKDLNDLLCKWGATIESEDHWQGSLESARRVRMTIYIPTIFDSNNEITREYVEVDLGDYISPEIPNYQNLKWSKEHEE